MTLLDTYITPDNLSRICIFITPKGNRSGVQSRDLWRKKSQDHIPSSRSWKSQAKPGVLILSSSPHGECVRRCFSGKLSAQRDSISLVTGRYPSYPRPGDDLTGRTAWQAKESYWSGCHGFQKHKLGLRNAGSLWAESSITGCVWLGREEGPGELILGLMDGRALLSVSTF